jgi:hypothetical protein
LDKIVPVLAEKIGEALTPLIEDEINVLVLTYFIGITDIYKQNNSNSTIGFRNKQMLFLNLFPMKNIQVSQTNIYACRFKF